MEKVEQDADMAAKALRSMADNAVCMLQTDTALILRNAANLLEATRANEQAVEELEAENKRLREALKEIAADIYEEGGGYPHLSRRALGASQ